MDFNAAPLTEGFREIPRPYRQFAITAVVAPRQADNRHARAVFGNALHSRFEHGVGIAFGEDLGGTRQNLADVADSDSGAGFSKIKRNDFDTGSLL